MGPENAVYIVQGEINLLITAMRKHSRFMAQKHQSDEVDPLITTFGQLKEKLRTISAFNEVAAGDFLNPFLSVIRSEETTGPITGIALTSVSKFLAYGLIDAESPGAAGAIENVADAVTHARFVGTDPNSDEVVLMKILHVLRTLLLTPPGRLLTNESVCEIMQSCFRICFEMRLSELLRRCAEHTLMDIVQLLFSQLPMFKEDPKYRNKKLKMRAGVLDSSRNRRKKGSPSKHEGKSRRARQAESAAKAKANASTPAETAGIAANESTAATAEDTAATAEDTAVTAEGAGLADVSCRSAEMSHTVVEIGETEAVSEQASSATTEAVTMATEEVTEATNPAVTATDPGYTSETEAQVEFNKETHTISIAPDVDGVSHLTYDPSQDTGSGVSEGEECVNTRGVKFTSTQQNSMAAGPLVPYDLPCVRELFRFLISLTSPFDQHNSEVMIHMGLNLLTVALEAGADHLSRHHSLMALVRDDLCKNLYMLLHHERLSMFAATLRLSFLLYEALRLYLKLQMESFLIRLMEMVVSDSGRISPDQREMALECVVQMLHIPGFVTELFLNYDCDLYCSNLYEDLMKLLSKNAFPVSGLQHTHLLSLDALLVVVESIEQHCHLLSKDSDPPRPRIRPNRMTPSTPLPSEEHLATVKHTKKLYQTGTEQFNLKPARGVSFLQEHGLLSSPLNPQQLVAFLRDNPRLDKLQIGEYVSCKKSPEILQAFLQSFTFEETRMDEALRMFLESFRLPGEAPVIQYILEHYADHWHKVNGEPFANSDAAFTLAYAVIMLNVDQHNVNAKKQNIPMTFKEFQRNLKGVNGRRDFDEDMLEEVFNSIHNEEIVMPSEQSGLIKENYLWKVLLRRSASKEGVFLHAPTGCYDRDLFTVVWGPTVAALSFIFDKCPADNSIVDKAIAGFKRCALIAAHYNLSEVFDNLVISLCKFTSLLSSAETPESLAVSFGSNVKAQTAAKTVFNLAHRHGDILREGWKNILDCVQHLFTAKLLPDVLVQVEDFLDPNGSISLIKEDKPVMPRTDSGVLSSFYNYFSLTDTPTVRGQSQEDQEARKCARSTVEECHIEQLILDTKFLRTDALHELIKALLNGARCSDSEAECSEEAQILLQELLVKVVLQNRDRMVPFWQSIREHFYSVIGNSSEPSFLLERTVTGLIRVAMRLLRREDTAPQVLSSLQLLLLVRPRLHTSVCRHVVFGVHDLLKTNAANIHTATDWDVVFSLLQVFGAGALPAALQLGSSHEDSGALSDSEVVGVESSDQENRGYTSDSEVYATNSWTLVNREECNTPSEEPSNQFNIELSGPLRRHDPKALIKASETLTFLVRDAAHVTPLNFESCVHCLRVFVKASVQPVPKPTHPEKKPRKRPSKRRSKGNSPGQAKEHSDSEEDETTDTYTSLAIQLLDLMHTLHTRASNIHSSCPDQENSLWIRCWCPLLQGMAVLCCDRRRHVRSQALTYLQRALLVHDLRTLSAAQWEECFSRVLFPLLHRLLQPINSRDVVGVEETRMRAATLLCKVFLQHLTPLLTLPTLTALWLTILDFMDKYMHADSSDLLSEAIPESLKNMLLVMHTAGVLDTHDSQFWSLTFDRIQSFLPNLKDELFAPPQTEPTKNEMDRSLGDESQVAEAPAPVSPAAPAMITIPPGSLPGILPHAAGAPAGAPAGVLGSPLGVPAGIMGSPAGSRVDAIGSPVGAYASVMAGAPGLAPGDAVGTPRVGGIIGAPAGITVSLPAGHLAGAPVSVPTGAPVSAAGVPAGAPAATPGEAQRVQPVLQQPQQVVQ